MSSWSVIKDTIYYGVIPKLTVVINIIILPIITPYLTTFDYGVSGVITSYSSILLSIAPLGLHVHLTNSYYEYPNHYNLVWGRVLFLVLVSCFIFGCLNVVVLSCILPITKPIERIGAALVGTTQVFLYANALLAQHLFPLCRRPKPLVLTNLFGSLTGIAVSFVLIYFFRLGFWGLIILPAIASAIVFIVNIKNIWIDYHILPIVEHKMSRIREMLKIALPLIPHNLGFVLLYSSSRIIMGMYKVPYDDIGVFSHGCTMGDYAIVATTALVTALSPKIQEAYRSRDFSRYRSLYYICQIIGALASAILCIWMPNIYSLLIKNDQLHLSCNIASIMCFANVVMAFYTFLSTPVFIKKNTKQLLWLVFTPGILNVIICFIFIPIFGYKTAVYSTIISYWTQLIIPFVIGYYRKEIDIWFEKRLIILLFIILCSLFVFSQFAASFTIPLKIVSSVLICFTAFFLIMRKQLLSRAQL